MGGERERERERESEHIMQAAGRGQMSGWVSKWAGVWRTLGNVETNEVSLPYGCRRSIVTDSAELAHVFILFDF